MVEKLRLLNEDRSLYLNNLKMQQPKIFDEFRNRIDFVSLFKIEDITFDNKAPRKEALENVISSVNIPGVNFVYMIVGDGEKVSFFYGVARDFSYDNPDLDMKISEIGDMILKSSIKGNFRGSKVTSLNANQRKELIHLFDDNKWAKNISILEGVPGVNKDDESFQAVDRIADVMMGDRFVFLIVAKPLKNSQIMDIQSTVCEVYNDISKISRSNISKSETEGKSSGKNESITKGESRSKGNSDNSKGISSSSTEGISSDEQRSKTSGVSYEELKKDYGEWLKYIDDVILPRLDYGRGKGLFISSAVMMSGEKACLIKLENIVKAVYSGKNGNKVSFRAFPLSEEKASYFKRFQIPKLKPVNAIDGNESIIRNLVFQISDNNRNYYLGNWISSKELSMFAGLPQKEVAGLALREEVNFGLNFKENSSDSDITIGYMVQNGEVFDGFVNGKIPVRFSQNDFDKHIFVTGVTGGGKTNTCKGLLSKSGRNFLVIEPAKTEYRELREAYGDELLVFTIGQEDVAPFRLNPLEFSRHENISSRVDMFMACLKASFDMDAAIPQIIEAALYDCYEAKGWDIATGTNADYSDPFADGVCSFPTLSDLKKEVEQNVKAQGFDDRLEREYLGSINARLQGMMVGVKGIMLNTERSLNFEDLLDRKVVIELENVKSGAEKSLIMGFVLTNLIEAIKAKGKVEHITLIEEAHRLLSKYMPGDSLNKKQAVETFSDMLAEVRKYGEGLIISDQIPNTLTPEVLKNTNTKIVHKIFAQDDKEAIGNTMALNDEQKKYLSILETGRAAYMSPYMNKAMLVQVDKFDFDQKYECGNEVLHRDSLKFYRSIYKKGVLAGLQYLDSEPSDEVLELYFEHFTHKSRFCKLYSELKKSFDSMHENSFVELKTILNDFRDKNQLEIIATLTVHNSLYGGLIKTKDATTISSEDELKCLNAVIESPKDEIRNAFSIIRSNT